jgi:hypothetical protein
VKRFTVTKGDSPDTAVTFECDELPADAHNAPYVRISLNEAISREAVTAALVEIMAPVIVQ